MMRENIADAASGDPARRLQTTAEFVERLVNLDRRRAERRELERSRLIGTRRTAKRHCSPLA